MRSKFSAYSVYLFSEFTVALLFSMIFTVDAVYQVSTVGLNALQLVLVGTTLEVSAFVFEIPTGVVADVYQPPVVDHHRHVHHWGWASSSKVRFRSSCRSCWRRCSADWVTPSPAARRKRGSPMRWEKNDAGKAFLRARRSARSDR